METRPRLWLLVIAAAAVLLYAADPAQAQADFTGLRAKPGDIVHVTETSGVEVSGRLASISSSSLSIDGHRFEPNDVMKIERRGDSLLNGVLIGMGAGAAQAWLNVALGECGSAVECRKWPSALAPVVVYGAIGAFIDWRHKGRTVVYDSRAAARRALHLAPAIAPGRKGLDLVVSF